MCEPTETRRSISRALHVAAKPASAFTVVDEDEAEEDERRSDDGGDARSKLVHPGAREPRAMCAACNDVL